MLFVLIPLFLFFLITVLVYRFGFKKDETSIAYEPEAIVKDSSSTLDSSLNSVLTKGQRFTKINYTVNPPVVYDEQLGKWLDFKAVVDLVDFDLDEYPEINLGNQAKLNHSYR